MVVFPMCLKSFFDLPKEDSEYLRFHDIAQTRRGKNVSLWKTLRLNDSARPKQGCGRTVFYTFDKDKECWVVFVY